MSTEEPGGRRMLVQGRIPSRRRERPDGLRGEEIPLGSRIIAVVDAHRG